MRQEERSEGGRASTRDDEGEFTRAGDEEKERRGGRKENRVTWK